jgi:aminoglycoside phosphotransferase (APT) family kinase protein
MPTSGSSTPDDDGRAERLVRPALDLISACAEREPDLGRLLADAERALDRLRSTPLPIVAEHGDFRPPNLIIARPGVLGVVDWELAEPSGFPLYDLSFFHAFVVDVVPDVGADVRKAGVDAVLAIGLDADLFDALRSLAMLRQLANLVERGTRTTTTSTSPAVAHSDVAQTWFATLEDT